MNLSSALHNIHADPFWWRKVLLGGACVLSIVGAPWAAGLVVESMDNVRKGYPTPLPPNIDPWSRYIIGFFALMIDIVFFAMPLFGFGVLFLCAAIGLSINQNGMQISVVGSIIFVLVVVYIGSMLVIGISPIGRLLYCREGRIEQAITREALRAALKPARRRVYANARWTSLLGYLPLIVLIGIWWGIGQIAFPGQSLALLLVAWLASSAFVYAHLVVAQMYGDTERQM